MTKKQKQYKIEYMVMPYSNSIFFIVFKKRFKIWWPLQSQYTSSKFGYINSSNNDLYHIDKFVNYQSILEFRHRPMWYWIHTGSNNNPNTGSNDIKTIYCNELSEFDMEIAEYLI